MSDKHNAGFIPLSRQMEIGKGLLSVLMFVPGSHPWNFALRGASQGVTEFSPGAHKSQFERVRKGTGEDAAGVLAMLWAMLYMWANNAYPVVRVGHKYAAALACSSVSSNVDVRPPWDGFVIDVPRGLFWITGQDGRPDDIYRVYVGVRSGEWSWFAFTESSWFHRWRIPLEEFCLRTDPLVGADSETFAEMDSNDERCQIALSRFIVSVCLAMSDPRAVRPVGKGHGAGQTKRESDQPIARVFEVGRPITIDCRAALSEYLRGEAQSVKTVQWLVRGHWRNQAHGPELSQHKLIWIEPHWKGPEDAPIVVRPHILPEMNA